MVNFISISSLAFFLVDDDFFQGSVNILDIPNSELDLLLEAAETPKCATFSLDVSIIFSLFISLSFVSLAASCVFNLRQFLIKSQTKFKSWTLV